MRGLECKMGNAFIIADHFIEYTQNSHPVEISSELLDKFRTGKDTASRYRVEVRIVLQKEKTVVDNSTIRFKKKIRHYYTTPGKLASDGGIHIILYDLKKNDLLVYTREEFLEKALVSALALFCRYALPKESGTFLHAAGIVIDDRAFLFPGEAGKGKTTLAQKASEAGLRVLSDECVFVSCRENIWTAAGTPFGTLSDGPLSAPVAAVFFLEQSSHLSFRQLKVSQAIARALCDSFYMSPGMAGPEDRKLIFTQWYDLFAALPACEMAVPLVFDDWDSIVAAARHRPASSPSPS